MPDYISAFRYQQENNLTRQRVIELAEKGPAYWKALDKELFKDGVEHGYYTEGFSELERRVMKVYRAALDHLARFESKERRKNSTGFESREYFFFRQLSHIISYHSEYHISLYYNWDEKMTLDDYSALIRHPPNVQTDDEIWMFLKCTKKSFIEKMFQQIFKENLFFDRDNLPEAKAAQGKGEAHKKLSEVKLAQVETAKSIERENGGNPFAGLPPLKHMARISSEGTKERQMENTRNENPIVGQYFKGGLNDGMGKIAIAKNLIEQGVPRSIMACFVFEKEAPTAEAADQKLKRELNKTKGT